MYVRSLQIENLRAFGKAKLDLLYPQRAKDAAFEDVTRWPPRLPNVNVILGANGAGKSTILDATALALLSPLIASSGYRPFALIRRSNRGAIKRAAIVANLVLHEQDGALPPAPRQEALAQLETVIDKRGDVEFVRTNETPGPVWERMYDDNSTAFLFVGYGATRRVEAVSASDLAVRRKSRLLKYERVASLFEDHFALVPLNAWLPDWKLVNPGRYRQVVNLIDNLTPAAIKFSGELEQGEYLFKHRNMKVPFSALSDGYRAYIGWIGDLLHHLCMGAPSGAKLVESRGVVMVDEIDLHIHPDWQRTIIPTLARTLKNLQFIFTTHSPLVVGTLERANILTVDHGRNGMPVIGRPQEETFGLSADQVLRSAAFGLSSTRDPEFSEDLRSLSQAAQNGSKDAALQFMREAAIGGAARDAAPEPIADPPDWMRQIGSKS
jgi:hypothetical protein